MRAGVIAYAGDGELLSEGLALLRRLSDDEVHEYDRPQRPLTVAFDASPFHFA